MTPKDYAQLACEIYQPASNQFDAVLNVAGVCVGVKQVGDVKVIACRGSANKEDWRRDFYAVPLVVPNVGTVHSGMWQGVPEMYAALNLKAGDTVAFGAHSLGCSHAAYLARLCLNNGVIVLQMVLLAPPRAGYQDFYDGIKDIPTLAYHNTSTFFGDPVPDWPEPVPELLPWHQHLLKLFTVRPAGMQAFIDIAWHGSDLYLRGIT